MSAATTPVTFADLYTALLNKVRESTTASAVINKAKGAIDYALQDMHIGFAEKVPWAEREATLILRPRSTTGTVSINRGSTTLTGVATGWTTADDFGIAAARAGGKIRIDGTQTLYRVSAVGGAGSITLASAYVGDDVAAGSTYVYFEDEYALAADFLRPLSAQFFDDNRDIQIVSRADFRERIPRNFATGAPRVATIVDQEVSGNTTPVRKLVIASVPDRYMLIPYQYVTSKLVRSSAGAAQESFSADDDEPLVPKRYRMAIVFHALYHWYRDGKDDARSQEARAEYVDLMSRIVGDSEIGQNKPRIRPAVGAYVRAARRPWRTGAGRFDVNGAFDRLEDRG